MERPHRAGGPVGAGCPQRAGRSTGQKINYDKQRLPQMTRAIKSADESQTEAEILTGEGAGAVFSELLAHAYRGGPWGAYWYKVRDSEGDKETTAWFPTHKPLKVRSNLQHCYFNVHPRGANLGYSKRGKDEDVVAVNLLYADFDAKDWAGGKPAILAHLDQLRAEGFPYPTTLVDSGGGVHAYWWLEDTFHIKTDEDRERIKAIQQALVHEVNADTSVHDLARVLRIPGTKNHKYDPPAPVGIFDHNPKRLYQLSEFEELTAEKRAELATPPPNPTPAQPSTLSLSDAELIDKAMNHHKHGHEFRALWAGDTSKYGGDQHRADAALCRKLAWLTGKDSHRMDVLFRASGLMRPKWDERRGQGTYGSRTIERAIPKVKGSYDLDYKDPQRVDAQDALQGLPMKTPHGSAPGAAASTSSGAGPGAAGSAQPGRKHYAPKQPQTNDYFKALDGLGYVFHMNQCDDSIEVNGEQLSDGLEAEIQNQMRDIGYTNKTRVLDAIVAYARQQSRHPVKDYFSGLTWDGMDWIRKLSDYGTDKHTLITYADGSKERVFHIGLKRWLIGAVAKVFETGVLGGQNIMLVLDGGQDLGKSTFVHWLGSPIPAMFYEGPIRPDDKEHLRYLAIKWVWEVAELGSTTRKADRESLKDFLTKSSVTFRVPYGKHPIQKPALASFIGTINNEAGFLTDTTGNRRFFTVGLTSLDWAYLKTIPVDQLWAQAYALYKAGEPWRLLPEENRKRNEINQGFEVEDPVESWILEYFDINPNKVNDPNWSTPSSEVASELSSRGYSDSTTRISMQVANTLARLGLQRDDSKRPRVWLGIRKKPIINGIPTSWP